MNNEIAKKIFDELYDDDDLKELKRKGVIAQELGFELSTVAIIECELDEHYKKLLDFVNDVAEAKIRTQEISGQFGGIEELTCISDLYSEKAKLLLKELEK